MLRIVWLSLVCAIGIILLVKPNKHTLSNASLKQYEQAASQIPSFLTLNSYQSGVVYFDHEQGELTEQRMQQSVRSYGYSVNDRARPLSWFNHKRQPAMLSAMGLDWQHHFANSYLVGVRPFPVKNAWLPLYVIAQRKTYEYDKKQYQAPDIWQNSAQAYQLALGDCEDHAILLADWLISEGLDARVVVGKYKQEGHAWVVVKRDQEFFLLEATDKRLHQSWRQYPLAKLTRYYSPSMMFNRTDFWINKSRTNKNNYHQDMWIKTAQFKRDTH